MASVYDNNTHTAHRNGQSSHCRDWMGRPANVTQGDAEQTASKKIITWTQLSMERGALGYGSRRPLTTGLKCRAATRFVLDKRKESSRSTRDRLLFPKKVFSSLTHSSNEMLFVSLESEHTRDLGEVTTRSRRRCWHRHRQNRGTKFRASATRSKYMVAQLSPAAKQARLPGSLVQ